MRRPDSGGFVAWALFAIGWAVGPSAWAAPPADPYELTLDLSESIRLLGEEDSLVREPAELLLEALGPRAVPALRVALTREDEPVRVGVVEILSSVEREDAAEIDGILLEVAREDAAIGVRALAVESLAARNAPEAAQVVPGALASEDPRLYRAALVACGSLCVAEAQLDRVVDLVFLEPAGQMSAPRGALIRLGSSPKRRPSVEAALERGAAGRLASEDAEERLRAALVFADVGDERALAPLEASLTAPQVPVLQVQALVALGRLGNEATVAKLAEAQPDLAGALGPAACKALVLLSRRDVAGAEEAYEEAGCP